MRRAWSVSSSKRGFELFVVDSVQPCGWERLWPVTLFACTGMPRLEARYASPERLLSELPAGGNFVVAARLRDPLEDPLVIFVENIVDADIDRQIV